METAATSVDPLQNRLSTVPIAPAITNNARPVALTMGVLTATMGGVGLLGWLLDSHWLRNFGSVGAPIKANTALVLLLLGVYLIWVVRTKRPRLAYALPVVGLLLAGLTLLEWATGLNLGIDQWLFSDPYTNPLVSPPGRPSLLTAGCLACLSGAALLTSGRQRLLVGQALTLLVGLLAFGILLGHLTGTRSFYAFGNFSAVALHTALSLLAAAVGVLALHPQQGLMQTANSPYWGGVITRYIAVYVLVAPPLLTVLYHTSLARQLLIPETGLPLVLFMFMFITFLLFYGVANRLNRLDEQSRFQYGQLQTTEQAHKQQTDLLESISNASQTGVLAFTALRDEAGVIVDFVCAYRNAKALHFSGKAAHERVGQRLLSQFPIARELGVFDRYVRVVETGDPITFDQQYAANGLDGWFTISVCRWGDGILVDSNDITDLRRAEREELQQAEFIDTVLNSVTCGVMVATAMRGANGQIDDLLITAVNQQNLDKVGRTKADMIGQRHNVLFPVSLTNGVFDLYVHTIETGQLQHVEFHFQEEKQAFWVDLNTQKLGDGLVATWTDISDRKEAELALKRQNDVLTGVVENGKAGITLFNPVRDEAGSITDFRYVFTNAVNSRNTGRSVAEMVGNTLLSLLPGIAQTDWYARLLRTATTGQSESFLFPYEAEGIRGWFDTLFVKLGDQILFTDLNVTELKDAEVARTEQAELLERVMNTTPTAIVLHESIRNEGGEIIDFRMTRVNHIAANLMQTPIARIEHRRVSQFFPNMIQNEAFEHYRQVVETGEPARFETKLGDRWYDFSVARFGDGMVVAAQDNTDMRQHRYQLELANHELRRLNDNLQSFAYVTSHDLQEPLRKLSSFANILQMQYGPLLTPEVSDIINRMNSSAERMRLLIQDLLAYSRVGTQQDLVKAIDLKKLIAELQENELWSAIYSTKADLRLTNLPTLQADPFQMRQLFPNLLSNALKFCPSGVMPVVSVTARLVDRTEIPVGLLSPVLTGDSKPTGQMFYEIAVTDNGIGFDEKYLDRIFQLFQRLHGRNQYAGSGIGLAICQKIVERHNGAITASSSPGKGSTFQVFLPAPKQ